MSKSNKQLRERERERGETLKERDVLKYVDDGEREREARVEFFVCVCVFYRYQKCLSDDFRRNSPILNLKKIIIKRENGKKRSPSSSDDQSSSPPKRRKKFDFKESAVGTVQEMYLENFMCHEQLRVAFGPHLNIITGRNGSGKSAILAGLQVCLGASARATNRGNKIGDLVRNDGGNRAYVSVRLSNRGSDAFEPRTYGTEITVERSIAKKGASTFKIKNDRGKVISTEQGREKYLQKFNIQVDNPVCILDQQSAKSFIQGKDDAKYSFFLKATELEKLQEEYMALKEQLRIMKNNMEVAKRGLPKLKNQRDELETKLKKCEELERSMAELKSCEMSLEWASVREMERK